jgi:hypothetical protein
VQLSISGGNKWRGYKARAFWLSAVEREATELNDRHDIIHASATVRCQH